jgi:hypothetical protein
VSEFISSLVLSNSGRKYLAPALQELQQTNILHRSAAVGIEQVVPET